jgi:hypothetical protein
MMANLISIQTIIDGPRSSVIKIGIVGDGSGEEASTVIYDASAYTPPCTNDKLMKIEYSISGFSARLDWDAIVNVPLMNLVEAHPYMALYDFCEDSMAFGGIPNNGGTGRTGDILITTFGLGLGDSGHIILYINKKDVAITR